MQLWSASCNCRRKLVLLLGFWEHHLRYPVMWVAMLGVPCFYRNLCLDLPDAWSLPTIEDGMCKDHSIHVHSISTKLWLFFFVSNWSMIMLLDAVYRRIVEGRT